MAPDESNPNPAPERPPERRPFSRRGGRGGRRFRPSAQGRRISAESSAPPTAGDEQVTSASPVQEAIGEQTTPKSGSETPHAPQPAAARSGTRVQEIPAQHAPIRKAIHEVEQVIRELRRVLEQMEDVSENLGIAEIQQGADEKEIHTLRQALRQLRDQSEDRPAGRRR